MGSEAVAPTRPVLRYHGGKWLLAPWVLDHLPSHRVYVEPFGGAASVLLRKPRSYAEVYNDLDREVVSLFRVLRDPAAAAELDRLLRLTPFARTEFEEAYLPAEDPIERARRMMVRSFMGFGSGAFYAEHATGFRYNTKRSGTTPAHDWAGYPDALKAVVARLNGVVIENRDACRILHDHDDPEALFFVDPPYPHATRGHRHRYRHEMTDDQHRKLAEALRTARGMVVLSGYPCDLYDSELFPDWHRVTREAYADGARDRVEVLWINPAAWERLQAERTPVAAQRSLWDDDPAPARADAGACTPAPAPPASWLAPREEVKARCAFIVGDKVTFRGQDGAKLLAVTLPDHGDPRNPLCLRVIECDGRACDYEIKFGDEWPATLEYVGEGE